MLRILRKIHGWLGIFVMPLILVIGLTGLYLNHSRFVIGLLPGSQYDEAKFDEWPNPQKVDEAAARALAAGVFPGDEFKLNSKKTYHNREAIILDGQNGRVIVATETGHYWVKTRMRRLTFDPDGRKIDSKIYWHNTFKTIHRNGWFNNSLGSWLADITAVAMVIFGASGAYLFISPRMRRRKNRREVVDVKWKNTPRPKRIRLKK